MVKGYVSRADRGVEQRVPLDGLDVYQIESKLEELAKAGGVRSLSAEEPAVEEQRVVGA